MKVFAFIDEEDLTTVEYNRLVMSDGNLDLNKILELVPADQFLERIGKPAFIYNQKNKLKIVKNEAMRPLLYDEDKILDSANGYLLLAARGYMKQYGPSEISEISAGLKRLDLQAEKLAFDPEWDGNSSIFGKLKDNYPELRFEGGALFALSTKGHENLVTELLDDELLDNFIFKYAWPEDKLYSYIQKILESCDFHVARCFLEKYLNQVQKYCIQDNDEEYSRELQILLSMVLDLPTGRGHSLKCLYLVKFLIEEQEADPSLSLIMDRLNGTKTCFHIAMDRDNFLCIKYLASIPAFPSLLEAEASSITGSPSNKFNNMLGIYFSF